MDTPPEQSLVLANRVIKQLSDHLLGGVVTPEPDDYRIMRVIFRNLGGNWTGVYSGSIDQLTLLEKVVTGWGAYKQKAS